MPVAKLKVEWEANRTFNIGNVGTQGSEHGVLRCECLQLCCVAPSFHQNRELESARGELRPGQFFRISAGLTKFHKVIESR